MQRVTDGFWENLKPQVINLSIRRKCILPDMDKKIILWLAKGILIIVAASWLFYGNIYFSILMSPWLYLYIRENSKNNKRKERQQLALQFKDAMTAVSFALNAGYSIEEMQ